MRLVILSDRIPPEAIGGAGKVAWALACGLRDAGHNVQVIAATPLSSFKEERYGIPTYHLHSHYPERWRAYLSLYNPQTLGPLRQLLTRLQPDVINAHNIHTDLSYHSLVLAHRLGIPVVLTSHDVMSFAYSKLSHFIGPATCHVESPQVYRLPRLYNLRQARLRYNPLRNVIIRQVLRNHVYRRVAVSEAHRQALEANGLPPFQVVYNGLDPAGFDVASPIVEKLRQRLDLTGRQVILFGGRLSKEKGINQLLAALDRLVGRIPKATLLILSRNPVDSSLLDPVKYPNLSPQHIRSGGWLEGAELAAAYHLANLIVCPSICFETFGMTCLEGMAAAKPVVAACFGGLPEVVEDGQTGYVINPFDTETFTARLADLLLNPDLAQRMGQAGYERLVERFTLAEQVTKIVAVYEEAICSFRVVSP